MKNLKKLFLMLGILFGLFACSSLPTEEDSSSSVKSSVQFTMQNVSATNSNILFSSTDEQTPSKVAISYKKSGEEEVTSTFIELIAFGSSYITSNTITLEVGDYYVTKFDVLNSSGNTIFSTPMKNSPTAIASGVTKALEYSFSVESGVSNTETMQVVAVDSTTDPYDFGFTDFTFEVFSYNKFYIVARILDESTGWVHTEAIVSVANSEGATIKTDTISGAENKIIMAKDDSYKITISKNGYTSQELSFTADSLETYKSEPLIVNLQKASRPENVDYVVALDGSGDFTSIQTAIEAAEAGSTIFVKNGIYEENISFEKNLNLIGENIENTIVHGKNNGGLVYTNINSGSSLIKNFTFSNGGTGVHCYGSGYMTLKNIIVKNNYMEESWAYVTGILFGTNGLIENVLVVKNEKNYSGQFPGPAGILVSSGNVRDITFNHVTVADNISTGGDVSSNFLVYQDTKVTINNSIITGYFYDNGLTFGTDRTTIILNNTTTTGSGVIFKDDTTYQLSDESFGKNAASDGEDMGFVLPSE